MGRMEEFTYIYIYIYIYIYRSLNTAFTDAIDTSAGSGQEDLTP